MPSQLAYRAATVVAVGTALVLLFGIGALGVVGAEGDPGDRLDLGALLVGVVGGAAARAA